MRVHAIGAHLSGEVARCTITASLQVEFDDGSVGWYEAAWGPMISEVAFFVKDVIGPKGSVSIVMAEQGADTGQGAPAPPRPRWTPHTKTNAIRLHHAKLNKDNSLAKADELLRMDDEPGHDELCRREQLVLLNAIRKNVDLTAHMEDAISSLRIVLAADESVRTGKIVTLRR